MGNFLRLFIISKLFIFNLEKLDQGTNTNENRFSEKIYY